MIHNEGFHSGSTSASSGGQSPGGTRDACYKINLYAYNYEPGVYAAELLQTTRVNLRHTRGVFGDFAPGEDHPRRSSLSSFKV